MIVKQVLLEAMRALSSAGIEEPRLEAELLMRHVLGWTHTDLHLGLEAPLSPAQKRRLDHLMQRRLTHEPLAYITGYKEFFGIELAVNSSTLIPRPDTEVLVEQAIGVAHNHPGETIVDVGTGSGAIAIALAVHLPDAAIQAVDISASALEVAALNASRNGVAHRIRFRQSDLLEYVDAPVDLIVANLPYISQSEMTSLADDVGLFEPSLALAGGDDGLDQIRRLLAQAQTRLRPGGTILLEVGCRQSPDVVRLAQSHFPGAAIQGIPDLGGHLRVISIRQKRI